MDRLNERLVALLAAAIVAVAVLLTAGIVLANPPEGADLSLAPWYHGLKVPGTGMSCCSMSDCRPADYVIEDGRYKVTMPDGRRDFVPDSVVLHGHDNPTGRGVLCWTPWHGPYCFVPAAGT